MHDLSCEQLREFFDRLGGPEGCDFRPGPHGIQFICAGGQAGHPFSRKILTSMGISEAGIAKCIVDFERHGGFCDCEVLFNACERMEEEARRGRDDRAAEG
jgi:hypothetical protein